MASVQLQNVTKAWGEVVVSKDINLDIHEGEFVVFVGPSGCGKSTLLRMIAGLETITSGDLFIGEKRMNDTPPAERGVGMVFQSYALYPHLSVAENMSFGLKLAGAKKEVINQRVNQVAEVLQLAHLLDRKPKALSGGQRQRVAIGRTLVAEPSVFLLDEPLSNLDAALRVQMRIEISRLHKRLGRTMIYVTHDQVEAMTLAQRVMVMYAGQAVEYADVMDLYTNPCHPYTQGLLKAIPNIHETVKRLHVIKGAVPSPKEFGKGCRFRCAYATERCTQEMPQLYPAGEGHSVRCFRYEPADQQGKGVNRDEP